METKCAKVLIIDQDETRRKTAANTLNAHRNGMKFTVKCLSSCKAALNAIQNDHFDAVGCQEDALSTDFVDVLRRRHPKCALVALEPTENTDFRRNLHPCVDESVPTGTSDAWQAFPTKIRQAILRSRATHSQQTTYSNFKAIIQNAPDAIICISPAGRITEFNAKAEQLWHIPRNKAINADFLETCFSQQERFRINCEMQLLTPGESATDLRSFITHPNGRETMLSWDFSSVSIENRTENGGEVLFVAVSHELKPTAGMLSETGDGGRVPFNTSFNDTVDLVLNSLCAIMERIDCINARTTPEVLDRLRGSYDDGAGRRVPPKTAAAVERLILGLITEQRQVS